MTTLRETSESNCLEGQMAQAHPAASIASGKSPAKTNEAWEFKLRVTKRNGGLIFHKGFSTTS